MNSDLKMENVASSVPKPFRQASSIPLFKTLDFGVGQFPLIFFFYVSQP